MEVGSAVAIVAEAVSVVTGGAAACTHMQRLRTAAFLVCIRTLEDLCMCRASQQLTASTTGAIANTTASMDCSTRSSSIQPKHAIHKGLCSPTRLAQRAAGHSAHRSPVFFTMRAPLQCLIMRPANERCCQAHTAVDAYGPITMWQLSLPRVMQCTFCVWTLLDNVPHTVDSVFRHRLLRIFVSARASNLLHPHIPAQPWW